MRAVARYGVVATALIPDEVLTVLLIAAGATGVAYYGYSSHQIGRAFGMVSVPYPGVYAALLLTAFSPAVQSFDRPAAILMSLVSWGLYSAALFRSKVVKRHLGIQVAAVGIGFVALVVFPLISLASIALTVNVLYRSAAIVGWTLGARPGFGPKKDANR